MSNYTFTFTADQLKLIDAAISELPYRIAAPLVADMNRQINDRQQQKEQEYPAADD